MRGDLRSYGRAVPKRCWGPCEPYQTTLGICAKYSCCPVFTIGVESVSKKFHRTEENVAKIARAYVLTEADRERVAKATGLRIADVHAAETKAPPKMRKDELLAVEDLTCFGDNRDDIAEAIRAVRREGADIIQIGTQRLCGDGAVMLAEALQKLAQLHPTTKARRQAAIDTARKRTDDGRCSPERLFELWGSRIKTAELVSKSGWPQATIYKHFARLGITREQAGVELANRRKAKRRRS